MVASVPLEQKRTFSTDGTIAITSSAKSLSASDGAPNDVPPAAARCTAPTTPGSA